MPDGFWLKLPEVRLMKLGWLQLVRKHKLADKRIDFDKVESVFIMNVSI